MTADAKEAARDEAEQIRKFAVYEHEHPSLGPAYVDTEITNRIAELMTEYAARAVAVETELLVRLHDAVRRYEDVGTDGDYEAMMHALDKTSAALKETP